MPGNPYAINGVPTAKPQPKPAPAPIVPAHSQNSNPLNPGANDPGKSTESHVRAMQQFLVNRGYKIGVDGIRGPETNAAVLAFHKKVAPASWNSSRGKGASPSPAATDASSSGSTKVTAPPKGKGAKPAAPVVDPATGQLIDPTAYAHGLVNAEYNPQIDELLRQQAQGRTDEGSHTQQIQDWFNQAMGVQGDMAKANTDAGQQAEQGYDKANANILNLFGGPDSTGSTASEAAAFHDIGAGNLASDVNAQGQFDKNLHSITAVQGANAQRSQHTSDEAALKELASKLVDMRGAKGAAYGSAYQQGVQNRTQQEAAQQSLALAKAMAPAQIATAQAQATTAQVNAKSAAAQSATQLAIARTNLKRANIATQQALAAGGGKWNLALPAQQGALQKAFETNIYGPKGGLSMNPETAWANLQQQLVNNGLQNDPQAQRLAQGTFLQGLWSSHSNGNFGGFAWNGKKIVRTGNAYKFDKKSGKRSLVDSKGKPIPDYKPYR